MWIFLFLVFNFIDKTPFLIRFLKKIRAMRWSGAGGCDRVLTSPNQMIAVRESAGTPSQWLSASESDPYCQSTRAAGAGATALSTSSWQLGLWGLGNIPNQPDGVAAVVVCRWQASAPFLWAYSESVTIWVCQSTRAASGITCQQQPATGKRACRRQRRQVVCNSTYHNICC